jgi:hypothetical protein
MPVFPIAPCSTSFQYEHESVLNNELLTFPVEDVSLIYMENSVHGQVNIETGASTLPLLASAATTGEHIYYFVFLQQI